MKNSALAVLMTGSILIASLVLSSAMYIYNSSQITIQNTMETLNTEEKRVFNQNFETYEGIQTGSNVKAMLTYVRSNARLYEDEPYKVVSVYLNQSTDNTSGGMYAVYEDVDEDILDAYNKTVSEIVNSIEYRHTYYVVLSYNNGLIDGITINYDSSDHTSYFD